MQTLYIVACGAQKRTVRSPAKELYTGSLFRAAWFHADRFAKEALDVRILSAKHGLLYPNQLIDPYDVSLDQLNNHQLARLATKVGAELPRGITMPLRVVMLASEKYVDLFRKACKETAWENVPLRTPLAHKGMFDQRKWLFQEQYPVECDAKLRPLSCLNENENRRLHDAACAASVWWATQLLRESPAPEPSVFAEALAKELCEVWDGVYAKARGEWPEDVPFDVTFQNAPGGHLGKAFKAIGLDECEWYKREWGDRHFYAYMRFSIDRVSVTMGAGKEQVIYGR